MVAEPEVKTSSQLNKPLLEDAWRRFSVYDRSATAAQKRFTFLRKTILTLGVIATTLAIVHATAQPLVDEIRPEDTNLEELLAAPVALSQVELWIVLLYDVILRGAVIITPITVSILLAGAVKFDRGVNWILLRASAEAIKREIYRYRSKVSIYRDATRDANLASEIRTIGERLMKTQVNQAGLAHEELLAGTSKPLQGASRDSIPEHDDQFSELDAVRYLQWRLIDQLKWYRKKTRVLDKHWQIYQWLIYVLGGVGTFLAAIQLEVWIAVSNTIAAALASFLEFRQLDATLTSYNQSASNLENILCWWHALSPEAQAKFENFEKLVENTEAVIQAESTGWVQEMRDALAGLYKEEEKDPVLADDQLTDSGQDTVRAEDNAGHGRTLPSQEPTHETDDVIQPVPRV